MKIIEDGEITLVGEYMNYSYKVSGYLKTSMRASWLIAVFEYDKYSIHSLQILDANNNWFAYYNEWRHWIIKPKSEENKTVYRKILKKIIAKI